MHHDENKEQWAACDVSGSVKEAFTDASAGRNRSHDVPGHHSWRATRRSALFATAWSRSASARTTGGASAAPSRTWTTIRRRGLGLTSSRASTPGIDAGKARLGMIVAPAPAWTKASAVWWSSDRATYLGAKPAARQALRMIRVQE